MENHYFREFLSSDKSLWTEVQYLQPMCLLSIAAAIFIFVCQTFAGQPTKKAVMYCQVVSMNEGVLDTYYNFAWWLAMVVLATSRFLLFPFLRILGLFQWWSWIHAWHWVIVRKSSGESTIKSWHRWLLNFVGLPSLSYWLPFCLPCYVHSILLAFRSHFGQSQIKGQT